MTTRGVINSNFYQIVNVDVDGNPTDVKPEYLPNTGNANYANFAGTAFDVSVANVVGIGNIATVNLDGSSSNVLYGNGIFAPGGGGGGNGTPGGANTYVQYNNNGNFDGTGNFTFDGTNVTTTHNIYSPGMIGQNSIFVGMTGNNETYLSMTSISGFTPLSVISAGNILLQAFNKQYLFDTTGNINLPNGGKLGDPYNDGGSGLKAPPGSSYAILASNDLDQYVQADNVAVYIGTNYPANNHNWTFQKDGNATFPAGSSVNLGNLATANYFSGDGGLLTNITYTGNVANSNSANYANYANFAGTAYSVSGANVSGVVANANYANYSGNAYSVDGANVVGQVGNANYSSYSNYAYNVSGANIIGNVANANYSNFAGEAYNVTGSNVIGSVANSNYSNFSGTAYSVSGSNVVGTVANATYAITAGTAYSVSGGNVVGEVANANYAVYSGTSYSVSGSNVVGQVANALVAGTVYSSSQPNITSVGSLVSLDVDGVITGHANISGTYILGNGAFLTGVGNFSAAKGYFGSFFSNANQTASSTTTAYPITLNNSDPSNYGVNITSSSHINFPYAGTYNLQYSFQITNTTASIVNVNVWLRKNGTDVPDTNSQYATVAKHGSINGQVIAAINYIITPNANDYYELIWQTEDTGAYLEYIAPGTTPTTPAAPSAIVTAVQVTNVQAATLSGDLTGNLIGNSYGLTGVSFVNITGNIEGNVFTGNGSGLTNLNGSNVTGYVGNATHANISDVANLAYSVSGSNVTSQVANANYSVYSGTAYSITGSNVSGQVSNALIAGTVYTNSQPNITSVGTLTGLVSTGNITAPYFIGNVVGNISGNIVVPGLQWDILYNDGGNAGASDNLQFNATSNILTVVGNIVATYYSGNGAGLTNINGSNVSNVANANYSNFAGTAYSVSGSNVSGIVANANYSAYSGNAFSVTGSNVVGTVANANYASYAGNAFSVTGSNVSGIVANANYASYAGNAFSVDVGNVVGIGNIATINLDGNSGNILYGNGVFSAAPTVSNVANANYANYAGTAYSVSGSNVSGQVSNALVAGTVYTNAQPNITSVGSLTGLTVNGTIISQNIIPNANVTYSLGNNTNRFKDLYLSGNSLILGAQTLSANSSGFNMTGTLSGDGGALSNIVGANVTGTVANANYASYAGDAFSVSGSNVTGTVANANYATYSGTAYNVSVANVSGIGNIATLNLDGNVSNILHGNGYWGPETMSGNANYANYAGTVTTNAQPNITSVGTLTTLTVSGNINSNNSIAGNLITANSFIGATQTTSTTPGGTLNLTVTSPQTQIFTGSSIYNVILPDPSTLTTGQYFYINNNSSNNIVVKNYAGTTLYTVLPGANTKFTFTGGTTWDYHSYLPNTMSASSTTANLANLVVANYFSGNGSLLTGITSTTGNANYANYAGNAYSVTGSNVTGQVANALVAGTVYTNAQPNITSVGTLTSLSVTSNITAGNVAGGNLVSANYISANGSLLSSITGANVTGFVPNANIANTAYSVAVANVVGIGNIATTNYNGNGSQVLAGNGAWIAQSTGGTPGGSNTQIQFNDGGSFNGNANLTFDKTNSNLTLSGNLLINNHYPVSNTGNVIFYTYPISSSTPAVAFNILGNVVTFTSPATFNNGANSNSFTVTQGQLTLGGIGTTANLIINSSNLFQGSANIVYNSTSNQLQINSPNDINVAPTGNTYLGSNTKVKITGGSSGQYLQTDGAGNLSWQTVAGGASSNISNGTSNVNIATSGGNVTISVGGSTIETISSSGSNITGYVNATGNITGGNANLGNLVTSNYFAGTLTTAAQPNITSVGSLTSLTVTGNISTGNISSTGLSNVANTIFTKYNETVISGGSVSGALTPNAAAGTIYTYTLTGSITLSSLTNAVAGTGMTIILTQGGTGSYTLTSTMKFLGGAKTLSTAVGAIDIMSVFYDGSTYYASLGKGYA